MINLKTKRVKQITTTVDADLYDAVDKARAKIARESGLKKVKWTQIMEYCFKKLLEDMKK